MGDQGLHRVGQDRAHCVGGLGAGGAWIFVFLQLIDPPVEHEHLGDDLHAGARGVDMQVLGTDPEQLGEAVDLVESWCGCLGVELLLELRAESAFADQQRGQVFSGGVGDGLNDGAVPQEDRAPAWPVDDVQATRETHPVDGDHQVQDGGVGDAAQTWWDHALVQRLKA